VKILTKQRDKDVIESDKSEKKRKLLPKLNKGMYASRMAQKLHEMIICQQQFGTTVLS
jgi:hypothetical protein